MRKFNLYTRVILACLLLTTTILSGCSSSSSTITKRNIDEQEYAKEDYDFDTTIKSTEGFYTVATVGNLQLSVNGKTADVMVNDLKTKASWTTNPDNSNSSADGFLASQFSVSYIDDQDKLYEKNSYTDSVKLEQYSFYPLNNGIRVNYTVNEKKKEYLVPPVIGAERFEKILSKLSENDKMMLNTFYTIKSLEGVSPEVEAWQKTVFPALRYGDIYVLSSGYSQTEGVNASELMLEMIEPYFISAGYTKDDLKYDAEQNSLEPIDEDEFSIELSIEYTLDEDGLTAKIPQKSIIYDEDGMKLTEIAFLPFMGATNAENEGFLLVPDGSGAIINLNSDKKNISAYEKRVYSEDNTLQTEVQKSTNGSQIYLPVFGVSSNNNAMLAVIEKGDAVATIHADVSGKLNDYNYIYSSYCLIENSVETNSVLNKSGGKLYQKEPLESDIQIKYLFTEDSGTYVNMAKSYREYLLANKKIRNQEQNTSSIPFALNTIGAVSYTTTKLGIPVEAEKALTTFEQAQSILIDISKADIKNIVYSYSGWMNEGLYGTAPYKINPVGVLGGNDAFKELIGFTNKNNISFFPEANFSYVSEMGNGYSKNEDTARDLSGNLAKKHTYNLALQRWNEDDYQFIISSSALGRMSERFLKSYNKYGVSGISLPILSKEINGDYSKTACCDRQDSLYKITETFNSIAKAGYKIHVDGANVYALSNASFITGVPMSSGNHYLFDETVPFYQSVLHGILPYSSTPLNFSGNFREATLKCIEYGASPYFQWIYSDNIELKETDYNIYNVNYELWKDDAVNAYEEINDALTNCQKATIIAHEKISKDLYKTTYSNGYSIYVNYGEKEVENDGYTINACDYLVVKGA